MFEQNTLTGCRPVWFLEILKLREENRKLHHDIAHRRPVGA
jgi:hypothetical protein